MKKDGGPVTLARESFVLHFQSIVTCGPDAFWCQKPGVSVREACSLWSLAVVALLPTQESEDACRAGDGSEGCPGLCSHPSPTCIPPQVWPRKGKRRAGAPSPSPPQVTLGTPRGVCLRPARALSRSTCRRTDVALGRLSSLGTVLHLGPEVVTSDTWSHAFGLSEPVAPRPHAACQVLRTPAGLALPCHRGGQGGSQWGHGLAEA